MFDTPVLREEGDCPICFDTSTLTSLPCGHKYCLTCWEDYLSREVSVKKNKIICPGKGCNMVIDEIIVLQLLGDEEEEQRYKDSLIKSFVDDNPSIRWCTGRGCHNAIILHQINENRNEAVSCLCGNVFCFRCVEEDHRPCSCKMWRKWKEKHDGGDDSLNDQLIATITRKCTKCQTNIQKNGGCNHVKCTLCGYHFCWLCMGKFGSGPKGGQDGYNTHKCNKQFEDDENILQKQEELKRFQFYSERYNNHNRSFHFEKKLFDASPLIRMQLMENCGLSEQACSFYTDAILQLLKNRHLLKLSYVFGYFRPLDAKSVNKDIFENLQLDLEMHTEKLSHLLEDNSLKSVGAIKDGRREIVNQTKVAGNVLRALLDAASEWEYDIEDLENEKDLVNDKSNSSQKIPNTKKKAGFLAKFFSKRKNK
eukprot:TRINITY_DN4874_c0_g1_i3.p1 TRINITY_DN4874_c0_g1~~TRINITY_DN4874_c0_g1_i3.p1  ORF type:complete len:423 (-),score=119.60 TRINITY_DN4874_c0_g1_i3:42-1310(-)